MDEKQKKILLITLSGLVVIAFIFYELNKSSKNEDPWQDFTNPQKLDDRPSKSSIQEEKKRRDNQKFDFDRKVTRLEDFLSRQIIKDPFKDSVSQQPADTSEVQVVVTYDSNKKDNTDFGLSSPSSNTGQPTTTNSPNIKEEAILNEEPRRKTGFASGGIELPVKKTEEAISKTKVLAVIHENIQIKNGSKIKLRIIDSFIVGHVTVPMNSFVIGHVRLSEDHVYVDVNSIAVNGDLVSIKMKCYDLNGAEGIYVEGGGEGGINDEVLEETVNEIRKNVNIPVLKEIPFNTAKNRNREREVFVKAGYKLYLIEQ